MGIKYHLGCGQNYFPGYINVDFPQFQHSIANIKADIFEDLLTIKLQSCDEIRSHHVFEHFNYMESLALLVKWTQVLNIQGILRIDIPDLEYLCLGFINTTEKEPDKIFKFIRMIYGSHEADWAYHINGWTQSLLTFVLNKFGYSLFKFNRYGNIKSEFPNCGIDLIFKKNSEIANLINISHEILKLYVLESNEQKLYHYYCKKIEELCL